MPLPGLNPLGFYGLWMPDRSSHKAPTQKAGFFSPWMAPTTSGARMPAREQTASGGFLAGIWGYPSL